MSRVVCVCHKLMRAQNDQKGEPEDAIKKFIGAEKDLGFIYPLPNKVRGEDIKTAVAELKKRINTARILYISTHTHTHTPPPTTTTSSQRVDTYFHTLAHRSLQKR